MGSAVPSDVALALVAHWLDYGSCRQHIRPPVVPATRTLLLLGLDRKKEEVGD